MGLVGGEVVRKVLPSCGAEGHVEVLRWLWWCWVCGSWWIELRRRLWCVSLMSGRGVVGEGVV